MDISSRCYMQEEQQNIYMADFVGVCITVSQFLTWFKTF